MPIKFNCSNCGKGLSVPDSFAGKKARCPGCNEAVGIPASSRDEAPPNYDKDSILGDKAPLAESLEPVLAKIDFAKAGRIAFAIGFVLMAATLL